MPETTATLRGRPIRVAELTRYLKYLFERDELLAALSVQGEIAEMTRSAAGHVYFTLKDDLSQVSCVLFRREALQRGNDIADLRQGAAVIVHGLLTVYEPRGNYQIYVERVIAQGEGAIFQRFEKLRARLEQEGLFAAERKRQLPEYPRRLALITSPGSQAYHDVLHRLRAQYPFVTVIEVGASVQGDGAADEMAMAIDIVNRLTDADVILLVRGGGSPEDLAAFNEERLARAIFASRIPVVTGVGHETDRTIVDYVADVRAATPSLAATAAVPNIRELVQRSSELHLAMTRAVRQRLQLDRSRWVDANRALLRCSPADRLRTQRQRADELIRASDRAAGAHMQSKRARLDALRRQLSALDPLAILARGYSVLTDAGTGAVVGKAEEGTPGRLLRAQVFDGSFLTRVEAP
jgi:exodeoxyribonuclease VII large subunit